MRQQAERPGVGYACAYSQSNHPLHQHLLMIAVKRLDQPTHPVSGELPRLRIGILFVHQRISALDDTGRYRRPQRIDHEHVIRTRALELCPFVQTRLVYLDGNAAGDDGSLWPLDSHSGEHHGNCSQTNTP